MRAVIDPGALVSGALNPRGVCRQLLNTAIAGRFELIVCPLLLAELREVLLRPKFARYLSADQIRHYLALVHMLGIHQPDPIVVRGLTPDPDDDYLVALARASASDFIVSGDRHLVGLTDPQPPVLTPRAFSNLLDLTSEPGG